jgi:hypothetical protein
MQVVRFSWCDFMSQRTYSINSKVRNAVEAAELLSLMDNQSIAVGVAERCPTANLRFSRSEKEGNIVFAQMSERGFKVVDFKCNRHAVRRNGPVRVLFDCERSGADVVLDAMGSGPTGAFGFNPSTPS